MATLHVDCDDCSARGPACGDCVMGALLGPVTGRADFGEDEQAALAVLADAGLVPPLRMRPERRADPVEKWLRVV